MLRRGPLRLCAAALASPSFERSAARALSALPDVLVELLQGLKAARAETAVLRAELAARDSARDSVLAARDSVLAARDSALRAELAALRSGGLQTPSAVSFAGVGGEALAALAACSRISDAKPAEGAPVATPGDLARLRACTSERELVAAIGPLLYEARGFGEVGLVADPCACPR